MSTVLQCSDLGWSVKGRAIVAGVDLQLRQGETLGLIGPNGSGKSTLLKLLSGIRTPGSGQVHLQGKPLGGLSRRDVARQLAFVEQQADTGDAVTVRDAVELGRTPWLSALQPWSAEDERIVVQALADVDMAEMPERAWSTLSGGERQRVHIARALAQKPQILLLDEPTNHLDIQHQLEILDLVRRLPATCVLAIHDLNLAALFCDRLAVLRDGRLVAEGAPAAVLTAELIQQVWGVRAQVTLDGPDGRPTIRYRLG